MTEGGRKELYTKSISPFLQDREENPPQPTLPLEACVRVCMCACMREGSCLLMIICSLLQVKMVVFVQGRCHICPSLENFACPVDVFI